MQICYCWRAGERRSSDEWCKIGQRPTLQGHPGEVVRRRKAAACYGRVDIGFQSVDPRLANGRWQMKAQRIGGSGMRVEGGGACAACSKLCARLMFKLAYQMALCQGPCTTLGLWLMHWKEWVCGAGAVDGIVQGRLSPPGLRRNTSVRH